ncbi:MAG: hypothetical protein RLZ44_1347, partial [Pseudomonadota bacterium]
AGAVVLAAVSASTRLIGALRGPAAVKP